MTHTQQRPRPSRKRCLILSTLPPALAPILLPLCSCSWNHAAVDPDAVTEPSSKHSSSDASVPRLRLQNGASVSVKLKQTTMCRDLLFSDFSVEAWFRIEVRTRRLRAGAWHFNT